MNKEFTSGVSVTCHSLRQMIWLSSRRRADSFGFGIFNVTQIKYDYLTKDCSFNKNRLTHSHVSVEESLVNSSALNDSCMRLDSQPWPKRVGSKSRLVTVELTPRFSIKFCFLRFRPTRCPVAGSVSSLRSFSFGTEKKTRCMCAGRLSRGFLLWSDTPLPNAQSCTETVRDSMQLRFM